MDWIRFVDKLPPEDQVVMVSNGPAIGYYYFTAINYLDAQHKETIIPLWEQNGKRHEVKVVDLLQWTLMLKSEQKPLKVNKSLWKRFKDWITR